MAWLTHIEKFFLTLAEVGQMLLEAIAIICVFIGILTIARLTVKLSRHRKPAQFTFLQVRLKFGLWLAMALEFQLGADILNTTIAPSTDALIRLAVIAVIRTFLNYFLNKEMETLLEMQVKVKEHRHQALFADESPEVATHE